MQVLDLLKTALVSKSALTDLFISNKPTLSSRFVSSDIKGEKEIKFEVKLFVQKIDDRVLYAQVSKDFADFMLSILTYPLGAVIRLLEGESSIGSMDSLYISILQLDSKYMTTKDSKKRLINPHLSCQIKLQNQILPINEKDVYYCYYLGDEFKESLIHDNFYITDGFNGGQNFEQLLLVDHSKGNPPGYVIETSTFLVTDGLVFQPSSPLSDLKYFNSLNVPPAEVKGMFVTLGLKDVRKANPLSSVNCCVC